MSTRGQAEADYAEHAQAALDCLAMAQAARRDRLNAEADDAYAEGLVHAMLASAAAHVVSGYKR